jgi:hypothetical protein
VPRQDAHQHKYQAANHPDDEEGDEFRSLKPLISEGELTTPPPANEGDREAMPVPTPPSQRLDGGVGTSMKITRGGGRGGQLGKGQDWSGQGQL